MSPLLAYLKIHWTRWLPAVIGIDMLYEAWRVYDAGNIFASDKCNINEWNYGGAFCIYGPKMGAALFGEEKSYLGLVIILFGTAILCFLLTVFLLRHADTGRKSS
ncbi:MAG: hypothetical protein K2Q32_09645 [Alphaproteobacteria bacterium]|nr:hypothetical protein [Alphaproteobacteria bacterium]